MSTALVSSFYDIGEAFSKNNGYSAHKAHIKVSERKSVPNFTVRRTSTPNSANSLSSCLANSRLNGTVITISSETATVLVANNQASNTHRKLDRSLSEPVDRSSMQQQQQRPQPANSSRYKTELCRPYEESGKCKYGDKCQFAHGSHELRTLARHPKYKTELCRTFHTIGFCPYGPRCHFIHNAEAPPIDTGLMRPKALSLGSFTSGTAASPPSGGDSPLITACLNTEPPTTNANTANVNNTGGYFDSDRYSITPVSTPTANNAFTFNSKDFSVLLSPPTSINRRVQEQNAYNTALNQFSMLSNNATRNLNIINDLDSVFPETPTSGLSPPPPPSPPSPPSSSDSLSSEMDDLSICSSPPASQTPLSSSVDDPRNILRLPIFSRLSTSDD